eukprot:1151710-Pelagomonas_calceolata.AAC.1
MIRTRWCYREHTLSTADSRCDKEKALTAPSGRALSIVYRHSLNGIRAPARRIGVLACMQLRAYARTLMQPQLASNRVAFRFSNQFRPLRQTVISSGWACRNAGWCHVKSWLFGLVIRLEAIIAGRLHCALL